MFGHLTGSGPPSSSCTGVRESSKSVAEGWSLKTYSSMVAGHHGEQNVAWAPEEQRLRREWNPHGEYVSVLRSYLGSMMHLNTLSLP